MDTIVAGPTIEELEAGISEGGIEIVPQALLVEFDRLYRERIAPSRLEIDLAKRLAAIIKRMDRVKTTYPFGFKVYCMLFEDGSLEGLYLLRRRIKAVWERFTKTKMGYEDGDARNGLVFISGRVVDSIPEDKMMDVLLEIIRSVKSKEGDYEMYSQGLERAPYRTKDRILDHFEDLKTHPCSVLLDNHDPIIAQAWDNEILQILADQIKALEQLKRDLNPKQLEAVNLLCRGWSQAEVAVELRVSKAYISQIKKITLDQLKRALALFL